MARRCKVCGEAMTYQVGEHYRNTNRGLVRYKDVRLYTCPEGCQGTYYDFRRARPADQPERVLGFIKVPDRELNVVDPLLKIGLVAVGLLMIAGFLVTMLPVVIKAVAITAIVIFGVWTLSFANEDEGQEGERKTEP